MNAAILALLLQTVPTAENVPLPEGHLRFGTPLTREHVVDGWETFAADEPRPCDCTEIVQPLVQSVTQETLAEAIESLRNVRFRELSQQDAARFIGATPPSGQTLSRVLVEAYMTSLQGAGYPRAMMDLEHLRIDVAARRYDHLRPFLVRAAARHPDGLSGVPAFFGSTCADGSLHVRSLLFGYTIPPSRRAPVIVFLQRPPSEIYATAQIGW